MKLRLKEVLKEKGKTMSEVADNIGTKQAALSRAISEDGNPTLSLLQRIAIYLDIPITELFEPSKSDGTTGYIEHDGKIFKINSIDDIENLLAEIKKSEE